MRTMSKIWVQQSPVCNNLSHNKTNNYKMADKLSIGKEHKENERQESTIKQ